MTSIEEYEEIVQQCIDALREQLHVDDRKILDAAIATDKRRRDDRFRFDRGGSCT